MRKIRKSLISITALLGLSIFSGCNSGGKVIVPEDSKAGYLVDSAIKGVSYKCGDINGVTGSTGMFFYKDDCTVSLSIGKVSLGSIKGSQINKDKNLYPSDILGLDRKVTDDVKLKKFLQFIQSVDSDGDASNGINVAEDTQKEFASLSKSLNLAGEVSEDDLNSAVEKAGFELVGSAQALNHYKSTLSGNRIIGGGTAEDKTIPVFKNDATVSVDESQNSAISLNATDENALTYAISGGDYESFEVDAISGIVTFKANSLPDYESGKIIYTFEASATDGSNTAIQSVTINIKDVTQASKPTISSFRTTITEKMPVGTQVGSIIVSSTGDSPITGFSLTNTDGTPSTAFAISNDGNITVLNSSKLDYKTTPKFSLKAIATNAVGNSDSVNITILLSAKEATTPKINPFRGNIIENSPAGTVVGNIVIDSIGDTPISKFTLSGTKSSAFKVSKNGKITVFKSSMLDFETTPKFSLKATATNNKGASNSVDITILLIDVPEDVPTLSMFNKNIAENTPNGTVVGTINVNNRGSSAITGFTLKQSNGANTPAFAISNSGQITVKDSTKLNYEIKSAFYLKATATNSAGTSRSVTVRIRLDNVAEVVPTISIGNGSFRIYENSSYAVRVGSIKIDNSGDSPITKITLSGEGHRAFKVSKTGRITVDVYTFLDYEKIKTYSLVAKATNSAGESSPLNIEINIVNVVEHFISVWNTTSANETITIPINPDSSLSYDYTVNWGDGSIENYTASNATHTYGSAGQKTIKISGDFPAIYFNNSGDKDKIIDITSWGDISWKSMKNAFYGCSNLNVTALKAPYVELVTDMSSAFREATSIINIKGKWDASNVTTMNSMFRDAENLEHVQSLNSWNTIKLTNTNHMFYKAKKFQNTYLYNFNTSKVTDMSSMFEYAEKFDGLVGHWNTSKVTNMSHMFRGARKFNHDISNWDTSRVRNMSGMFLYATEFSQSISGWNTSHVTDMSHMFRNASKFYGFRLGRWDVSHVTNMSYMFHSSKVTAYDFHNWNVSAVTDMNYMFFHATNVKNRDLSSWDVSNVTTHTDFLTGAGTGNTEPNWP